jgi:D-glycero-D-manno-heptose 1,7-bisphosphate phosphatase
MRRLAMIDRDGTITVERVYLSSPDQLELLEGAASGIRLLQELGLAAVVVTNQSGVGRGFFDQGTVDRVHERLSEMLAAEGASIDAYYVCPHHPEAACNCRKPAPELAQRAAKDFNADLAASFVIGDKPCDIDLGKAVGATTILVRTGYGAEFADSLDLRPDYTADNLFEAACIIRELTRGVAAQ